MKDELERFIRENRDDFDIHEPSSEIWNRIVKEDSKPIIKKIDWFSILWKAAAVFFIFFASYFFHDYMDQKNDISEEVQQPETEMMIPELLEAEIYYTGQVNDKLSEVQMLTTDQPELMKDLNYDLNELDSVCAELKNDLNDNIANEDVIDAMIRNYRLKLKILEDLVDHMNANKPKTENYESIKTEI